MMPGVKILNSEEEKAIEELQMRMKNALTPTMREDPTVFHRFLRARDFDVDRAEKMMRKHITFRKAYRTDTILETFKPKEAFEKYMEPSFFGFDKDGDLVMYSATGKLNVYEVFKSVKINDMMKHWYWFGEKYASFMNEQSKKIGKTTYQGTLIMDLDKLTFGNTVAKLTIRAFLHFTHNYQDNYPERMKSLYIINAPSYYTFAFSILKTVMSNEMINKIHIYSQSGWKEKLLEKIDADVLPAFLGGNRTDPDGDPFCRCFISFGGSIPEKYFITDEERYFVDPTRVNKVTVPKSDKKEIFVDVKEMGTLMLWEFMVKGKDIGFGLCFKISEKETQEVLPIQKYDTSDGTEKDSYRCNLAGKYIVIFDNSYSWLSSKEVEYCITLKEPEV